MTQAHVVLEPAQIDALIRVLIERGFRVIGPTVNGGVVVHGEVTSAADLPVGMKDEQEAGRYRLTERGDQAIFGYAVGPTSMKNFLHPPEVAVWAGDRTPDGFTAAPLPDPPRYAFLGARPCDLAAVAVQDRVFLNGQRDEVYGGRRDPVFLVVVNCTEPAATCFCSSMGTGPRAGAGYDIGLTEVLDGKEHYFLADAGSEEGAEVVALLESREAGAGHTAAADRLFAAAAAGMERTLDPEGARELLYRSLESSHWSRVAERCLSCANCTLVCPTCFCATVEDVTDLSGDHTERVRRWDSCFTHEFSYIHGGPMRPGAAARYRQWITHKLAWWYDQFGTSGCVGCGRCITWCPVGIDLTAEIAAIQTKEEAANV